MTSLRLRALRGGAFALIAAFIAGCQEPPPQVAPAGETMVLGPPSVTVGVDPNSELLFSQITRVDPTPSGGLVLVERSPPRVIVFSSTGAVVDSMASEGDGPGELRRPQRAGFVADTLWVIDDELDRVSYYLGPQFLDSHPLPHYTDVHPERGAYVVGIVAERRALVHTVTWLGMDSPAVTSEPGIVATARGSELTSIASVNVDHIGGILAHRVGGQITMVRPFSQPFSESAQVRVLADGSGIAVAAATPDGYDVVVLSPSGDTLRRSRRAISPIPLPSDVADSIVKARAQEPFSEAAVREALYLPDHYPLVSGLVAAADGSIWVARERVFGAPSQWDVHASDGSVFSVEAPLGFDLKVPVEGGVWGVQTTDLGVEYLALRPLRSR